MRMRTLWLPVLCVAVSASGTDLLFLGTFGEGGPALERRYEEMVRDYAASRPGVALVSKPMSERFRAELDFRGRPEVSAPFVRTLVNHFADSVLAVWCEVRSTEIVAVRHQVFGVAARGRTTVTLHAYSPSDGRFAFAGDINEETVVQLRRLYLSPVSGFHIPAPSRAKVTARLAENAARASGAALDGILRNRELGEDVPVTGAEKYKVPSISDVFTMPSVEGAVVGEDDAGGGLEAREPESAGGEEAPAPPEVPLEEGGSEEVAEDTTGGEEAGSSADTTGDGEEEPERE